MSSRSVDEAVAVFGKGRLQLWNRKFRQVWGFEDSFLDGHPQIATLVKAAGPKLTNPARAEILGDLIRLAAKDRQQRGSSIVFADGRHFDIAAVPLPDGNAMVTMLDTSDRQRIERVWRAHERRRLSLEREGAQFVPVTVGDQERSAGLDHRRRALKLRRRGHLFLLAADTHEQDQKAEWTKLAHSLASFSNGTSEPVPMRLASTAPRGRTGSGMSMTSMVNPANAAT